MILLTYPRSGSHFLIDNLENNTTNNFQITRSHQPIKVSSTDNILFISRNPIDSIASNLAAKMNFLNQNQKIPAQPDSNDVDELICNYINMYYFIVDNSHIKTILFDILISDTHNTLKKVATIFNLNYVEKYIVYPKSRYETRKKFLNSSKSLPEYSDCYDIVLKSDLSKCFYLFKKTELIAL